MTKRDGPGSLRGTPIGLEAIDIAKTEGGLTDPRAVNMAEAYILACCAPAAAEGYAWRMLEAAVAAAKNDAP